MILTLPVRLCVSSKLSPKFVEPLALLTTILVIDELIISCLAVNVPLTVTLPSNRLFVFIVNPSLGEIDAETLPETIFDKFKPVTPLAGMLYNPLASPTNEPENAEAVTDPEILSNEPYNSINL